MKKTRNCRPKSVVNSGMILLLCLILSGCRSSREIGGRSHQQTDSIRTEIRWRYIHIHDTVPVYIPVEKQASVGEDSSHLETEFASSDAFVDSLGRLHHSLKNKARRINVPVEGGAFVTDTSRYESHAKADSIPIPLPYPIYVERELTEWQEFQLRSWWWMAVGLVGYILYKTKGLWQKGIKR